MKKLAVYFVIFTFISSLLPAPFAQANYLEPAVISAVDTADLRFPQISGETPANTEVLIYDNMKYHGTAQTSSGTGDKLNFSYTPKSPLENGSHLFKALARDKTSLRLSIFSNEAEVLVPAPKATSSALSAPTLIEPNENTITAQVMPLIKGLTNNHTKVNIYIDGVLNGATSFLEHESGTANFAYKPFLNLSVGQHTAWAVAVNKQGQTSPVSNILSFKIEDQLPAPITKDVLSHDQGAVVVGLVKNNLKTRLYIDHRLVQEIAVTTHPSGVANFAFRVKTPLLKGKHLIYTTAVDSRGKESPWSNIVYTAPQPSPVATGETTAPEEERVEVLSAENDDFQRLKELLVLARLFDQDQQNTLSAADARILKELLGKKNSLNVSAEESLALEKLLTASEEELKEGNGFPVNSEIEDIINQDQGEIGTGTGIINESKENQSQLKMNLLIFILFLLAVIAWIFWVNRELIKERREQNKQDDDTPSN